MTIQTLIDTAVSQPREKKEQTSWHPSKLGSCLCGAYLERKGVPADEEFDSRTLRVFAAGKHFEDWVCSLIKSPESDVQEQVRIEWPEMNVTGYADLLIGDLVYELKSKHSNAFHWMRKRGGPQRQHEMQLWVYLKVLDKPEGRLLYISKDDLTIAEYNVYRNNEELEREVMGELTILNEAWNQQLPPQPIRDEKAWQYKYCRWHQQCLNQPKYLT